MVKKKQSKSVDLLRYAERLGYEIRRRTSDGHHYVIVHGKTRNSLTIPHKTPEVGNMSPNWKAKIRRNARGDTA